MVNMANKSTKTGNRLKFQNREVSMKINTVITKTRTLRGLEKAQEYGGILLVERESISEDEERNSCE